MTQASSNPFVLPGFGQEGEAARNPLFAGLEMMRQAWQGMAGGTGFEAPGMPMMSIEDLDRRIGELRTVQNWLQLNASILGNTVQGLEIQRATLSTLRSFAQQGRPDVSAEAPARGQRAKPAPADTAAQQDSASAGADANEGTAAAEQASQAYAQAAGDWWNMLQQQFQTLADATSASMQTGQEPNTPAVDPTPRAAPKRSARTQAKPPKASKSTTRSSPTRRTKAKPDA